MFNIFNKKELIMELNDVSDNDIVSVADGELFDVSEVSDSIFTEKMMGDSIAFRYRDDKIVICSPANEKLTALFPTGHALGITMKNGTELLVHIGINTVNSNGKGFKVLGVKQNDYVKAGQPIVEVDFKSLKSIYDMYTILIITNSNNLNIEFIEPCMVKKGRKVVK